MERFGPVAMLDWARSALVAGADRNLARTDMPSVPWAELGVAPERLARCGADGGAFARELYETLARRHAVGVDEVALVSGATQGAFCPLAALIEPGCRVVVEAPTYGPLVQLARSLGAEVVELPRRPETGFLPDPDELRALLGPRTLAVVLTDLHNPSGVRLGDELTDRLLDVIEESSPAHLFVDEVYLEFDPSPRPVTAYRPGRRVAVARSMTKGFGMSWMRAGWVLASPELTARCRRVNDYLQVYLPTPSVLACQAALATDQQRRERAAARVRAGYALVRDALASCAAVELVDPHAAAPAICFPRLHATDATPLVDGLLRDHGIAIAPGHRFGAPAHARIACAADPATLAAALPRIAAACA